MNLIQMFSLEDAVDDFVKERVKQLVAEKHDVHFSGSNSRCGNNQPHIPHVRDHYETVRYGWLERFCCGVSGKMNEGELVIVEESYGRGSPETPAHFRGYWFVKEEQK